MRKKEKKLKCISNLQIVKKKRKKERNIISDRINGGKNAIM